MSSSQPGVNLYSPVGIRSGLGAAGRGYVAALRAAQVSHQVIAVHELATHQTTVPFKFSTGKARYPIAVVHVNADSTSRFLHFHGRSFNRARYRIGLWVWELATFRKAWLANLQHFDEIWVPSEFCRRAIAARTLKPVTTIPHVVAVPPSIISTAESKALFGWPTSSTVFLYVFDVSSSLQRKNPQVLLDAFVAEFLENASVQLVLKVSNLDFDLSFRSTLLKLEAAHKNITVIETGLTFDQLNNLYNAADCYVSPHRSEGFGLTIAEAMARRKPVIATDYGGSVDFLNSAVGYPLDYALIEINKDEGPYGEGFIWADPSATHLRHLLRRIVERPNEASLKATAARDAIGIQLSPAAVGNLMRERLYQIAFDQCL